MPEGVSDLLKELLTVGGVATTLMTVVSGCLAWYIQQQSKKHAKERMEWHKAQEVLATNLAQKVIEITKAVQESSKAFVDLMTVQNEQKRGDSKEAFSGLKEVADRAAEMNMQIISALGEFSGTVSRIPDQLELIIARNKGAKTK